MAICGYSVCTQVYVWAIRMAICGYSVCTQVYLWAIPKYTYGLYASIRMSYTQVYVWAIRRVYTSKNVRPLGTYLFRANFTSLHVHLTAYLLPPMWREVRYTWKAQRWMRCTHVKDTKWGWTLEKVENHFFIDRLIRICDIGTNLLC